MQNDGNNSGNNNNNGTDAYSTGNGNNLLRRESLVGDMVNTSGEGMFGQSRQYSGFDVDAAIFNLANRRLSINNVNTMNNTGTSNRSMCNMNNMYNIDMRNYGSGAMLSTNKNSSNARDTTSARQIHLQEQRLELQRRQKELEFQRQQLLNAMKERRQAMQHMQQSVSQHRGLQRNDGISNGGIGAATAHEDSNSSSTSKPKFLVCKFCKSEAYSSAKEALLCENNCRLKLENILSRDGVHQNDRRGSLDLLGALAGVTAETIQQSSIKPNVSSKINIKPIPLGLPDDKDWLTPLHCFVRLHCVEIFTANATDVAIPTKGKRKKIQIGQVGIRCPHCHHPDNLLKSRETGSVYYPTSVASIYNATMNLLQRHIHNCSSVKPNIMNQYKTLKSDDARSGTSKKYWAESALSLGLIDTREGIMFSDSDTPPPLPLLTSQQRSSDNYSASRGSNDTFFNSASNALVNLSQKQHGGRSETFEGIGKSGFLKIATAGNGDRANSKTVEGSASDSISEITENETRSDNIQKLVTPDDERIATQFSFYLLSQMQMCVFTEADRLGKRKGLPAGFHGLACRHCFGGYGSGRFFPSSIKTLSDTSKTLNVLHSHMKRCRKCPMEVRKTLENLRKVHDDQRAKMKFGSQKAFFARIWDRLHDNDPTVDSKKRKFQQPNKKKNVQPTPTPPVVNGSNPVFTEGLANLSTARLANGCSDTYRNNSIQLSSNCDGGNKQLEINDTAPSR